MCCITSKMAMAIMEKKAIILSVFFSKHKNISITVVMCPEKNRSLVINACP